VFYDEEPATVSAGVRLTPTLAAKLDGLARRTHRTRAQVLRLLLERATLSDLDARRYEAKGVRDAEE
jgi:predicted transcriptional regulator